VPFLVRIPCSFRPVHPASSSSEEERSGSKAKASETSLASGTADCRKLVAGFQSGVNTVARISSRSIPCWRARRTFGSS
jgi:hypothetical protein